MSDPSGKGPPRGGPGGPPPGGPQDPRRRARVVLGMAIAGVFAMALINVAVAFLVLAIGQGAEATVAVGGGAAVLALIALGGGLGLIALRRPWSKGLGMGLMIGWALISVISAGYCTGLNPNMYT